MNPNELSEQELIRRNSLEELRKAGIEPYPHEGWQINTTTTEILSNYKPELNNYQEVSLAGRIMSRRIMGSASFAEIQDQNGRIQIYIKRDDICPGENKDLYNLIFKKLLDIG
ncbi:MAG: lysine--tRNA ligase, partial [Bacteroidales bacterium]|nr:lysine--tRNA ligase [Bacteroidales bacterium]